jgi:hypothetical protein
MPASLRWWRKRAAFVLSATSLMRRLLVAAQAIARISFHGLDALVA